MFSMYKKYQHDSIKLRIIFYIWSVIHYYMRIQRTYICGRRQRTRQKSTLRTVSVKIDLNNVSALIAIGAVRELYLFLLVYILLRRNFI